MGKITLTHYLKDDNTPTPEPPQLLIEESEASQPLLPYPTPRHYLPSLVYSEETNEKVRHKFRIDYSTKTLERKPTLRTPNTKPLSDPLPITLKVNGNRIPTLNIMWFLTYRVWPLNAKESFSPNNPNKGAYQKGSTVRAIARPPGELPKIHDLYQSGDDPAFTQLSNDLRATMEWPPIIRKYSKHHHCDYFLSYNKTYMSVKTQIYVDSCLQGSVDGSISTDPSIKYNIALLSLALNRPLKVFREAYEERNHKLPDLYFAEEEIPLDPDDVPNALKQYHPLPKTYIPCYTDKQTAQELLESNWNSGV